MEQKILELFQRGPDSRHVGVIICAVVCEVSELSDIFSNRLRDMIRDKDGMRKAGRRQAELYELTMTVWCEYFPKQFEKQAQAHGFNDVHDDLYAQESKLGCFSTTVSPKVIKNKIF